MANTGSSQHQTHQQQHTMKTLIVLSALASIAIAAPSFLANDHQSTLPENWPEYRRDKKSPQGYFYAESAPLVGVQPVHIEAELDGSSPTGRSFGLLKKPHLTPTIIKRPSGYHVYRDSAEERAQADPSEDCSKQVKVKFCNNDKIARSTKEDDMENSIKMAKEAIEHLQRDLKNIEHAPKSASWSERDTMHEDIEVAKKALEHVHKNFGNLDSMSLHSTLVDEKPSPKMNEDSLQTHEERASQWKEHTKKFKSNEGARNMEDIVKSVDQHDSTVHIEHIDTTKLMKNSEKMEHLLHEEPLKEITEKLKEVHERHANTETNMLSDMKPSETKMEHNHQLIDEKSAEANVDIPKIILEEKNIESENLKAKASEMLASDKTQVAAEVDHNESHLDEKLRATGDHHQIEINNPETKVHQLESASLRDLKNIETNEHLRKSNENEWKHDTEKHFNTQPKNSFFETQSMQHSDAGLKSKHMKQDFEKSHFNEEKKFGNFETSMKSADHENTNKKIIEHSAESKLMAPTHILSEKSAVSLESAKDNTESHWAPLTNDHMKQTMQMKAATDFHNQHSQMTHHLEPTVGSSNHMDTITHPVHGHSMKIHEHKHAIDHAKSADDFKGITSPNLKTSMIVDHAKSADFNDFMIPNLPNNMIDFAGKSAMDLMQWTHKTDGGRSAYGGYGGSGIGGGLSGGGLSGGSLSGGPGIGGGAVGVFPNARVGGCAVPLLLSCSPSVVSGSLAKSGYGSSYGSPPAYRSADEFNSHNKRDTKKYKDVINKKNIKHRTIILDKKQ